MFGSIAGAWRFRHFIVSSVQAEFVSRFARSGLGALWMILNPLAQSAILAFVVSGILAAKLPGIDDPLAFALYMMAGMLCWSLFLECVTRCLVVFIENGALLKKLVFPRICLPLVVVGSALVGNLLLLLALLLVFLALGRLPGAHIAWLPVLTLITLALGLGVGLVLGVLNVFLRDVGQVAPIVLQFLFWLTPIVYAPQMVPERFQGLLALNPLASLAAGYQNVLVFGLPPDWRPLAGVAVAASILLCFAMFLFRRASAEMVDVL